MTEIVSVKWSVNRQVGGQAILRLNEYSNVGSEGVHTVQKRCI